MPDYDFRAPRLFVDATLATGVATDYGIGIDNEELVAIFGNFKVLSGDNRHKPQQTTNRGPKSSQGLAI